MITSEQDSDDRNHLCWPSTLVVCFLFIFSCFLRLCLHSYSFLIYVVTCVLEIVEFNSFRCYYVDRWCLCYYQFVCFWEPCRKRRSLWKRRVVVLPLSYDNRSFCFSILGHFFAPQSRIKCTSSRRTSLFCDVGPIVLVITFDRLHIVWLALVFAFSRRFHNTTFHLSLLSDSAVPLSTSILSRQYLVTMSSSSVEVLQIVSRQFLIDPRALLFGVLEPVK